MYAALNLLSSSSSSSLVDVNRPRSSFEVMLPTVLKQYEAEEEEEEEEEKKKNENENVECFWFLISKHRDRRLDIAGNEIILLSKRHPLHYVILTVKCWARLIGWHIIGWPRVMLTLRENVDQKEAWRNQK